MIELVFVACLRTLPSECEERSLTHLSEMGQMECMMTAQPQLAQWTVTHPGFTIARWTCRSVEDREIKA